jgi:uncharacterized protein with HEPN domain
MSSKDRGNLLSILDAIGKIQAYTKAIRSAREFHTATVVFDACLMNFIVIGEMADRISEELRAKYPDLDWRKVKDFRNLVAHDYLGIDAEEVWQIVEADLPALRHQLDRMIDELN